MADQIEMAKTEIEDLLVEKSEVLSMSEISKELELRDQEVLGLEKDMAKKMEKLGSLQRTRVMQLRKKAEGEVLATLSLQSGKEYANVAITQVSDVGISIRTSSGTARIPAEDLPRALQDRFQFSVDAAMAQLRAEQEAVARHESEMSEGLHRDGFAADPFAGAEAGASPSLGGAGGFSFDESGAAPVQGAPAPPKKEMGRITARIKGYRTGIKLVEFTGHANCGARVNIYGAVQGDCFFDIPANKKTEQEIWVYNNYTADLVSAAGMKLDEEKQLKKTDLGHSELER